MALVTFKDADMRNQEVDLDVSAYKAAADRKMSLTQYLNTQYPTGSEESNTFDQMAASAGLFMSGDNDLGISPPTLKQVLEGDAGINLQSASAPTARQGGKDIATPASRILFPEVVMRSIESELSNSDDAYLAAIAGMTAISTSVTTPRVEQPVINTTAPKNAASQPISQLALPPIMMSITTTDTSYRIPTSSISMEISDEALEASTLDLVGIAFNAQAREQAIVRADADLAAMISGDADLGESAVSAVNASTFDSAVNGTTHKMTQAAYVKFLRNEYRKRTIDYMIMDIDTALVLENRVDKPTINTDDPNSPRIDTTFSVQNLSLPAPTVLLVDTSVVGADTVIGLDSRYAIRKITNVSASYSAVEEYVLRRGKGLRVDYGYIMHKLMADAWVGMVIGA